MKKISHIIWSFSISIWIYYYLFKLNLIKTILFGILTSMISPLPDIDIKIINYFKKLNTRTFFISYPLYIFSKIIFKHRTITHSIWFGGIFTITYYLINNYEINIIKNLTLIISIAIYLHIFEDSLTISGVKPFYPINFKIKLWIFKTNSLFDEIIINLIGFLIFIIFLTLLLYH